MRVLDGPAAGVRMDLRCCPKWIRLVGRPYNSRREAGGVLIGYGAPSHTGPPAGLWDALDQSTDNPEPDETVHVYRLVEGTWGVVFVRPGGRWENGDYEYWVVEDAEALRDRDAWIAFVAEREGMTVEELLAAQEADGR